MSVATMLEDVYNQWIIKRQIQGLKSRKDTYFHCSTLSTCRCILELYHAIKSEGVKSNFPLNVLKIFENGNSSHTRIQTAFKEMGILKPEEEEKPFTIPEYNITGKCDGIVEVNGERFILEIKTISEKGFDALTKPKKEHTIQANLYMKGLKVYKSLILYENKNTQAFKIYYLEYDEEFIKDKLDMCKQVIEILKTDELPEGFKCRYINCQFGMNCKRTFFEKNKNELKGKEESGIVEKYSDNIFPQSDEGDVF